MRKLLSFPDPVNETSARLVAAGVLAQVLLFLIVRDGWLLAVLIVGFTARVATGPTLSPLGQFVARVVTPRLDVEHRFVPGPPKRFAQGIGLAFSSVAAVAWWADVPMITFAVLGGLIIAATLEAAFAVCLGCIAYRFFWECDECDDITERLRAATASRAAATN